MKFIPKVARKTRGLLVLTLVAGGLTVVSASPAQADFGAMMQPVTGVVTSKIDNRCPGFDNHDGIDLAAPMDRPVYAAYRGTVSFAGTQSGYGRIVIINHSHGYSTRYAHLAGFRVTDGQSVSRGERIGRVGQSGNATGPHLHFEVRRNGAVHTSLNQGYVCGHTYNQGARIQAPFPDLPA
ncbi:MAG TPA: M23 family metallopeptidase [Candidatus Limnocylindrales bacterium]|nr:M23 family metallopeptidase [Candidatus Limnocylindrales bacterium]